MTTNSNTTTNTTKAQGTQKQAQAKSGTQQAAANAAQPLESAMNTSRETAENAYKMSTEMATKGYEKLVGLSKEQMDAANNAHAQWFKGYEDAMAFQRDTVDAMMQSGNVFAQGVQAMNRAFLGMTQSTMEDSVGAAREVMGCKSLKELMDVQTGLFKTGFDRFVTESGKLTEQSMKVAEQTAEPLTSRSNDVLERVFKPMATAAE